MGKHKVLAIEQSEEPGGQREMEKLKWFTVERKVKDMIPYEFNPRILTPEKEAILRRSIEKFNLAEIPAVNTDGTILAGHQRIKVLLALGRGDEIIDVREPNRKLTHQEVKEYNVTSNVKIGVWDIDILEDIFSDIDLEALGLNTHELDLPASSDFDVDIYEDDFDAIREHEKIRIPQTKPGDIYELNDHKLICGDSTFKETYTKLFGEKKARLVFTDPPYNVNYRSQSGLSYDSAKYDGTGGKILNDDKSEKEGLAFYLGVLDNLYDHTMDDVTIYWWFASKNTNINIRAFKMANWHFSQIIIWLKEHFVFSLGQEYHRIYEPCMLGWKKGKIHLSNRKLNKYTDVFNLDMRSFEEQLDVWYQKRDNTNHYLHPTQKPVRLAERALKKNSEINDIVIDVFAGSGSTLIGCEQLIRICYLIELDPKFCDVIIKRWLRFMKKNEKQYLIKKNGKQMTNDQLKPYLST